MKNYTIKQKMRTLFTYLAYFIYFCFAIYLLIYGPNTIFKYIFLVISVFAMTISIYAEYLKVLYHKALYALNFEMNPQKAQEIFMKLEKQDYFNGYKNVKPLFYLQLKLELKEGNEVLEIIALNEKYLRSDTKMLFIYYYYKLRAYHVSNQHRQAQKVYHDMKLIKTMKKAPKIFSWDEIDGIYHLCCNNESKALKSFSNINMKNMNPKEQCFILSNLIKLDKSVKNKAQYQAQYQQLMEGSHEGK